MQVPRGDLAGRAPTERRDICGNGAPTARPGAAPLNFGRCRLRSAVTPVAIRWGGRRNTLPPSRSALRRTRR